MNTEHSPTPWRLNIGDELRISAVSDGIGVATTSAVSPRRTYEEEVANSAFIVRACNAHADLLAALEAVNEFWAGGDAPDELTSQMLAAIAKAKGE